MKNDKKKKWQKKKIKRKIYNFFLVALGTWAVLNILSKSPLHSVLTTATLTSWAAVMLGIQHSKKVICVFSQISTDPCEVGDLMIILIL